MSTFCGKLPEIPEISIDRFDQENNNSTIYFLSHCHTDHMRGLEDWSFQKSLNDRPDVYLYASPISVKILKHLFPVIELKLKELPMNNSTLIKFPYREDKSVTVTPMPAGHCPGSVMFLFETDKIILYTGDYRVNASDLKKYKAFYSMEKLKKIDKMYLDTTFFKLSYLKLPLRQNALEEISKIINEWIKQSKKHIVNIRPSARYGSEFLFAEIAKKIGMPIHVNMENYMLYKCIPEMDDTVTTNPRETQIHAGCGGYKTICESERNNNLTRIVIPSVLWWENKNFNKGCMTKTGENQYRVCYSCHASLEEINEFLLFLKPTEVEPCVVPRDHQERKDMFKLLERIMNMYKNESKEEAEVQIKLFEETITRTATVEKIDTSADIISEPSDAGTPEKNCDALDDILCSPTKTFKRRRV